MTQAGKLDELLALSRQREAQLAELAAQVESLTTVVGEQSKAIAQMQPTVTRMAEVFTFARIGTPIWRWLVKVGIVVVAFVWWMDGRWPLLSQLLKRVP